jgi:SAM-dependent methyltransferase
MDREAHWNRVYETKQPNAVSWYQRSPDKSLAYIRKLTNVTQKIIDVGGGASVLVDALLDAGYERPIVLDVSAAGLERAKNRLGSRATLVEWLVADVTTAPALPPVDLWHDRAVLHFLTEPADQAAYAALAGRTVRPGGHVVLATFAPDGPEKCSGLSVQRHDGASVARLLGPSFDLSEEDREVHLTPSGGEQRFSWVVLRRR